MNDIIPHCSHGNIILGCPHDDCLEQSSYLQEQNAALEAYYLRQKKNAHILVRETLGLPIEDWAKE